MKIRVGKNDCKFYVNKDKNTVTCVLTKFEDGTLVRDAAYCFLRGMNYQNIAVYPDTYEYDIKDAYVGIAKCSPEDEWNETIGRKIAFKKAKIAFYRDFSKAVCKYIANIDKASLKIKDTYSDIFQKVHFNIRKLEDETK